MPRLRIAIVGLRFGGHIVTTLREAPHRDLFDVVAVCDQRAELANAVARDTGATAYTKLDDVLADPNVEVVGLFTSPAGRADLIRRIVTSGRDVITTNPFERDPDSARAILMQARELNRVVHLNSPAAEPTPDLAQILRWQADYDLGRPVACRADSWVRTQERADGSWYDDQDLCPVAPVLRIGIYLINDLIRLLGAPEAVHVQQSRLVTTRPTADNAQVGITFHDGALATVFASFCVADGQQYQNSLVLNYERGTIYRNAGPPSSDAEFTDLAVVRRASAGHPAQVERTVTAGLSGDYPWETFHSAVTKRNGPLVDTDLVVAGIEVIAAMAAAARGSGVASVAS